MSTVPDTITLEKPAMGWNKNIGEMGVLPGTYEVVSHVCRMREDGSGLGLLLAIGDLDLVVPYTEYEPF